MNAVTGSAGTALRKPSTIEPHLNTTGAKSKAWTDGEGWTQMSETENHIKTLVAVACLKDDPDPQLEDACDAAIAALRACEEIGAAVRLARAGVTPGLDLDLIAGLLP